MKLPSETHAGIGAVADGRADGAVSIPAARPDAPQITRISDVPPFPEFLSWVADNLPDAAGKEGGALTPGDLFEWGKAAGLDEATVSRLVSAFTGLPLVASIGAEDLKEGVLPHRFCRARLVAPVRSTGGRRGIVVANPFDWELEEAVQRTEFGRGTLDILVAEPDVIRRALMAEPDEGQRGMAGPGRELALDTAVDPGAEHPIASKALALLTEAVASRASDIHFEPKEERTVIRIRIDGDMQDLEELPNADAARLISRYKALAGMNIAERRRPQDNSVAARIDARLFKLRLATSSTTFGESLVIRLLEPSAEPMSLRELGMSGAQKRVLEGLASRNQGLILFVGPTGSGKSTTIYSLLSQVDTRRRSLISVEDPVEYRIPFANQQQVNERAGVTFDVLLRSAVRQDPDILLLGEIRDLHSAKASMDFASSGHLTLTSMHSSNATTAVFRLERLGTSRTDMSEALIGIVAQKLLKRLCPDCKEVRDITDEEASLLAPFTDDLPARLAHPAGCPRCRGTGFYGREGLFEVVLFDAEMAALVREGVPIHELRAFARARGDELMGEVGLRKLREMTFTLRQVYDSALAEEGPALKRRPPVSPLGSAGEDAARAARGQATADWSFRPGPEVTAEGPAARDEEAPDPVPGSPGVAPPLPDPFFCFQTDEDHPKETRPPPPARDAAGPASILVVDDDATTTTLLAGVLADGGYRVVVANDGADALLKLGGAGCDLILSDVNMPNLDGFKLLEIVNQQGLDTPVILLTGESRAEAEVKGLELGAADYIRKPIQGPVILHRIRRILES